MKKWKCVPISFLLKRETPLEEIKPKEMKYYVVLHVHCHGETSYSFKSDNAPKMLTSETVIQILIESLSIDFNSDREYLTVHEYEIDKAIVVDFGK